MKIGFIGLGIMGRPMAGHLQAAGHALTVVRHRVEVPAEILAGGAVACESAAQAAREAEVVILMVPDTPDVAEVLFGTGGVAEGLAKGKTVIDMSSISPTETKKFAARINDLGCDYVDAPVSGGEAGAKNAALTIMVGGPQAAFDRVKPLFEIMGKNITLVGTENGNGTVIVTFTSTGAVTIDQIVLTRATEDDTLVGGANPITDAEIFAYIDVPNVSLGSGDSVQYTWTIDVD